MDALSSTPSLSVYSSRIFVNLEANFFLWSAPLEWSRMYCFPELQPFPQSPSLASAELMGAGLGCEDPSLHPQDMAGRIPMAAILLSLCPGLHLTLAGGAEVPAGTESCPALS